MPIRLSKRTSSIPIDRLVILGVVAVFIVAMVIAGAVLIAKSNATAASCSAEEKATCEAKRKAGIVLVTIGSAGVLAMLVLAGGYAYFRNARDRNPGTYKKIVMTILGIKGARYALV